MQEQVIEGYRLSPQQKHLWLLQDGTPYRSVCAVALDGPLDAARLRSAVTEVVARHEILRTGFRRVAGMKVPVQAINESGSVAWQQVDLSGQDAQAQQAKLDEVYEQERARGGVELERGAVLQATLVALSPDRHVLVMGLPALCADARTLRHLVGEISRAYDGDGVADAGEEPLQYADFAEWRNEMVENEEEAEAQQGRAYWRKQIESAPPALTLPWESPPRGGDETSGAPQRVGANLDRAVIAGAEKLATQYGVTVESVLLGCWQVLLERLGGQTEVAVGYVCDGRKYEDLDKAVGLFAKTLPVRGEIEGGTSFRDVVRRAGGAMAEAREWEAYYDGGEATDGETPEAPIGGIGYEYAELEAEQSESRGVRFSIIEQHSRIERFKLKLNCVRAGAALRVEVEYDPRAFDRPGVERLVGYYAQLLASAVGEPATEVSRLKLLTDDERQKLVAEWNQTSAAYPRDLGIHQLFEQWAAQTPEAAAVVAGERRLTYGELNGRANQLAHHLRRLGVGASSVVGLLTGRSIETMVGIVGILKAGGAYLPLNTEQPAARLLHQLADAGAEVLVTDEAAELAEYAGRTLSLDRDWGQVADEPASNPAPVAGPEDMAYVIYTSGSTGVPKGVGVRQRNLVNYAAAITAQLGGGRDAEQPWHYATVTTVSADLGNTSIFAALTSGGCVHLVSHDEATDAERFARYMTEHGIDVLKIVPSHLSALLGAGGGVLPRRYLVLGGEALSWELVKRVREVMAAAGGGNTSGASDTSGASGGVQCRVMNHYGPTETTVGSLTYHLGGEDEPEVAERSATVPVGRPIANTQAYLLDEHLEPVAVGVVGELYIGGAGVAAGYVNRAAETDERFVADRFSAETGARMYRTGDVARRLAGGEIEFLGRRDGQVKVRGYRVEVGEVEAALRGHAGVREAVVVAREERAGDLRLVAYVVATSEQALKVDQLRGFLRERLPEYMLPSDIVPLKNLPLTRNGKIDRRALPAPEREQAERRRDIVVAPRTPEEKVLAEIWAEVLGLEQVSVDDNFFELGGHSLLVTQVISRARAAFRVELPLRSIFESPTVAGLCESIAAARQAEKNPESTPISPVPREGNLPLSFAQERLWFLDQLQPGGFLYNVPRTFRINGDLNAEALRQTLEAITARHEVLRTTFAVADGNPVQVIAPSLSVPLPVTDLSGLSESEREAEARRLVIEETRRPFDLARGPLLRASLLRLADEEHVLQLTMHHIVSDGWSAGVLFRELRALYEGFSTGQPASLAELPVQYVDYAVWQRERMQGEVLQRQLSYWREQIGGGLPVLKLPADRPQPEAQSYRSAHRFMAFPGATAEGLEALSQQEGATLFMTLLAAFQTLLMRYSEQEDIVVGSTIAGRNRVETEGLIGFFTNTLMLRTDLSGNPTFRELLGRVREVTLGAYANEDVPFEKLVEELDPERTLSRKVLSRVRFAVFNALQPLTLPGLTLRPFEFDEGTTRYDLALYVEKSERGLGAYLTYKADLFDAATIARMGERFETLLSSIVARPDARLSDLVAALVEADKQQQAAEKGERKESKFKKLMSVAPKAVSVAQEKLVQTGYLQPGQSSPLVIRPNTESINLITWARSNREFLNTELLKHGGMLFRGFRLSSETEFQEFIAAISGELLEYSYRSTPRTQVSGRIYTSTEYPPDQSIPLHNEMSYSTNWPMKIWFSCVKSAARGGETPIADSRKVFARIAPNIRERFAQKGVMYVRNYGDGLDLSWQNVFQTENRAEAEEFCRGAGIEFEWTSGNRLRTRQLCQAVAKHPVIGEMVWFNQAHLFHVSSLEPDVRESLLASFREEDLPRNCYYGDGARIEDDVLEEIRDVYRQEQVVFPWQEGDILMLDNMLMAHGRTPFSGQRKVLVGMAEPSSSALLY